MTLEEAISNLETMKTNPLAVPARIRGKTIQLGIEALGKEKNMRMCHKVLHPADHCELPLLPSETE